MDLRTLKYFVAIVEHSGFSRASRALHIAQPALTHHVALLEKELGVTLLIRSNRGVVPTEAGMALYRNAMVIQRQLDQTVLDVKSTGSDPRGRVTVGMPTAVAFMASTPLLRAVRQSLPNVQLHIVENMSGLLNELLAAGRLDMSFLYIDQSDSVYSPIELQFMMHEELMLVTREKIQEPTNLESILELNWLLPAAPSGTRTAIDQEFARVGATPRIVAELSSTVALKSAVMSGLGATILPPCLVQEEVANKTLFQTRIAGLHIVRPLSLCVHSGSPLAPVARLVHNLSVQCVHDMTRSGAWPTLLDR